jgi:hypothetical protein
LKLNSYFAGRVSEKKPEACPMAEPVGKMVNQKRAQMKRSHSDAMADLAAQLAKAG